MRSMCGAIWRLQCSLLLKPDRSGSRVNKVNRNKIFNGGSPFPPGGCHWGATLANVVVRGRACVVVRGRARSCAVVRGRRGRAWSCVVVRGQSCAVVHGHARSCVRGRSFVVVRGRAWSCVVVRGRAWSVVRAVLPASRPALPWHERTNERHLITH